MKFYVDLNKVEDVKNFVKKAGKYDCDIAVRSQDRVFAVDGTSLIGLFSLDLSKPVEVDIKDREAAELFKDDIYGLLV